MRDHSVKQLLIIIRSYIFGKLTLIRTNEEISVFLDTFFVINMKLLGFGLRDNRSSGRVGSGGGTPSSINLYAMITGSPVTMRAIQERAVEFTTEQGDYSRV